MKGKRRFMIGIVLLIALTIGAAGCGTTPQDRISTLTKAVTVAEDRLVNVDATIAAAERIINEAGAMMNDPNVFAVLSNDTRDKIVDTVTDAKMILKKFKPIRAKIETDLLTMKAKLELLKNGGDVDFWDEAQVYVNAVKTIAPYIPGPYGQYISLGALIVGGIIGVFTGARQKGAEAARTQDRLLSELSDREDDVKNMESIADDIIFSVDKALEALPEEERNKFLQKLKAQMPETRAYVRATKSA
jgi:hypothetical protein